jgi:hypothetical protein
MLFSLVSPTPALTKGRVLDVATIDEEDVIQSSPSIARRSSRSTGGRGLDVATIIEEDVVQSCPTIPRTTRGRVLDVATIDEEEEDVIQSSLTNPRLTKGRVLDVATIDEEDVIQSSPSIARRSSRSTRGRSSPRCCRLVLDHFDP